MINIEDYREKIIYYKNANHALEDYIALFVKKETGGARVIHKNAAIKRMAAAPVFILLFMGAVIFHAFYHVWSRLVFIEVLAAIAVAFRNTAKFFTSERYLRQKVQAQPDEEINGILTGEMDHFWRMEAVWGVYGILLACALLLMQHVFQSPHMVFIKSHDGYILSNYTLSLV